MKPTLFLVVTIVLCGFAFSLLESNSKAQVSTLQADARLERVFSDLASAARSNGSVRVIVALHAPFTPEGDLDIDTVTFQRLTIKRVQTDLLAQLPTSRVRNVKKFDYIPCAALEADEEMLRILQSSEMSPAFKRMSSAKPLWRRVPES